MNSAQRTAKFLRAISSHLSGRPECKQVSYRCVIGVDTDSRQLDILDILGKDPQHYIYFYPSITVFPTRSRRKSANKIGVVDHVIQTHFPEIDGGRDILGNTLIQDNMLVSGIYEYQLSVTGKRRRWTRLN